MVNSWYPVYLYRAIRETNDLPFPFLIPRISSKARFQVHRFLFHVSTENLKLRRSWWNKKWKKSKKLEEFNVKKSYIEELSIPQIKYFCNARYYLLKFNKSFSNYRANFSQYLAEIYNLRNKPIRNSSTKKRHTFHRWHNFGATLSINISRSIEHDIRRERKRERGGRERKKK